MIQPPRGTAMHSWCDRRIDKLEADVAQLEAENHALRDELAECVMRVGETTKRKEDEG